MIQRIRSNEAGFTIIEVMVAVFLLLLGVLGAVTMIDTANGITDNTKGREGAFNLSREIIEAARQVDYDSLTAAGATATLQSVNGLSDADAATAGWQVVRRGVTYTVSATACTFDDPKDGGRSTADTGTYCGGSAAQVDPATHTTCPAKNPPLPCVDSQPDDFRKLVISSQWTINNVPRSSTQTALIVNPSGGRGPRISQVAMSPTLTTPPVNTVGPSTALNGCTDPGHSGANCMVFTVTTASKAGSVQWTSSDGTTGSATASASPPAPVNTWTFQYDLGQAGTTGSVLDGTYTISVQAFSTTGIAGDLAASSFSVNRLAPSDPSQFAGGRNDRNGMIVDFGWIRNKETDIVGYRVYQVMGAADYTNPGGADPTDKLVCGTVSTPLNATSCFDPSPPAEPSAVSYYIKAVDKDINGNLRESAGSAGATITTLATATAWPVPPWPGGNGGSTPGCNTASFTCLTAALAGGIPRLTWNNAATPATGHNVIFYRVYRDPGSTVNPSYNDRYDTNGSASLIYKDNNFGASTAHTYVVTAVDDSYSESGPLGPATTP